MSLPVPVDARSGDWPRKIANAINRLIGVVDQRETLPLQMLAADPASPIEGQAYYNTVTHKARVYDGTIWRDLW